MRNCLEAIKHQAAQVPHAPGKFCNSRTDYSSSQWTGSLYIWGELNQQIDWSGAGGETRLIGPFLWGREIAEPPAHWALARLAPPFPPIDNCALCRPRLDSIPSLRSTLNLNNNLPESESAKHGTSFLRLFQIVLRHIVFILTNISHLQTTFGPGCTPYSRASLSFDATQKLLAYLQMPVL
jgi:hypothetical protein